MTDKVELIKAEIERRIQECKDYKIESSYYDGLIFAFKEVRDFINSLPEEPVNEDLEQAAKEICQKTLEGETVVIDGYEYVVRSDAEECCKAGAQWQKEQMMKTAVDGKIYETQARSKLKAATIDKISRLKYRVGDKVKLIILKED